MSLTQDAREHASLRGGITLRLEQVELGADFTTLGREKGPKICIKFDFPFTHHLASRVSRE